jgi:hypothetical protein
LIVRVEADAACDFRKLQIPGRSFDFAYESDELITLAPRIGQLKSRRAELKIRFTLFPRAVGATVPARSHLPRRFGKSADFPRKTNAETGPTYPSREPSARFSGSKDKWLPRLIDIR